jgi:hypothetical protein
VHAERGQREESGEGGKKWAEQINTGAKCCQQAPRGWCDCHTLLLAFCFNHTPTSSPLSSAAIIALLS